MPWMSDIPCISFTFDDFPRSAYLAGGKILKAHKIRASYYASLGLMGQDSPSGQLFILEDLKDLIVEGHEIGSHTYDHLEAWGTGVARFEEAIIRNQRSIEEVLPGFSFKTLSYPIAEPHPRIKKLAGRHFTCCRGGGQDNNRGRIDLNLLKSCFIDRRNRDDADYFKALIKKNSLEKGWLIFSTHDISERPSAYGCRPDQFENIVRSAISSTAIILPLCEIYLRTVK